MSGTRRYETRFKSAVFFTFPSSCRASRVWVWRTKNPHLKKTRENSNSLSLPPSPSLPLPLSLHPSLSLSLRPSSCTLPLPRFPPQGRLPLWTLRVCTLLPSLAHGETALSCPPSRMASQCPTLNMHAHLSRVPPSPTWSAHGEAGGGATSTCCRAAVHPSADSIKQLTPSLSLCQRQRLGNICAAGWPAQVLERPLPALTALARPPPHLSGVAQARAAFPGRAGGRAPKLGGAFAVMWSRANCRRAWACRAASQLSATHRSPR